MKKNTVEKHSIRESFSKKETFFSKAWQPNEYVDATLEKNIRENLMNVSLAM